MESNVRFEKKSVEMRDIFVTGASRGIGTALAQELATGGHRLISARKKKLGRGARVASGSTRSS